MGNLQTAGKRFKALGTSIDIRIVVASSEEKRKAEDGFADAEESYGRFEKIFSRFDGESELSKLNGCGGVFREASADMSAVAEKSLLYHKQSRGLFDPRVLDFLENIGYAKDFHSVHFFSAKECVENRVKKTGLAGSLKVDGGKVMFAERMDFSGIAKGYVTDRVAALLSGKGWKNFLVDSGGDIYFAGTDAEGNPWKTGIEGIPQEKILFSLSGKAVATSGISRRKWEAGGKKMHHLVNPKDPNSFDFGLKSVTVVSETVEEADVWAKVLFLMGEEEGRRCASEKNMAAVFLYYNGSAWISSKAKEFLCQNRTI